MNLNERSRWKSEKMSCRPAAASTPTSRVQVLIQRIEAAASQLVPLHGGRPAVQGLCLSAGWARARRMVCAEGAGAVGPRARTRKLWWFATYTAGSSLAGRCSRPMTCQGAAKPSWRW